MTNPHDALQHLAKQLEWVGNFVGQDFWPQVLEACKLRPPGAPAVAGGGGQWPGAPAAPGGGAPWPVAPVAGGEGTWPWALPMPADLYVTPAEVVVCADLPGLAGPGHLAATLVAPTELVVEGWAAPTPTGGMVLGRECPAGYFARAFALPAPVLARGARARYADGVVEIRLARDGAGPAPGGVAVLPVQPG